MYQVVVYQLFTLYKLHSTKILYLPLSHKVIFSGVVWLEIRVM